MTTQHYYFQHLHDGKQRTTPFGKDAQALIAAANKAEVPSVVVPHVPSAGHEKGRRVYYKIVFRTMTVTKCDDDGVPIAAKWKGAPAGATYTHKLIVELIPEPEPLPLPAAAGGGGDAPSDFALQAARTLDNTIREMTAFNKAAAAFAEAGLMSEADDAVTESSDRLDRFLDKLGRLVINLLNVKNVGR